MTSQFQVHVLVLTRRKKKGLRLLNQLRTPYNGWASSPYLSPYRSSISTVTNSACTADAERRMQIMPGNGRQSLTPTQHFGCFRQHVSHPNGDSHPVVEGTHCRSSLYSNSLVGTRSRPTEVSPRLRHLDDRRRTHGSTLKGDGMASVYHQTA